MGKSLLVEYYNELPQRGPDDEKSQNWAQQLQAGLDGFKEKVQSRYNQGTLQRLLSSTNARVRRASVLALGMIGTMDSNGALAAMLQDEDRVVRQLATDALWSLWFQADTPAHNQELRRLIRHTNPQKVINGLASLIKKSPDYAEAYNQRAIVYFRLDEFEQSIADCEMVLKLNPYHFGAQAGLAQCYMKLHKPRAALKAFRKAFRINPGLDGVEDTIHFLEDALDEEGKKDDKK